MIDHCVILRTKKTFSGTLPCSTHGEKTRLNWQWFYGDILNHCSVVLKWAKPLRMSMIISVIKPLQTSYIAISTYRTIIDLLKVHFASSHYSNLPLYVQIMACHMGFLPNNFSLFHKHLWDIFQACPYVFLPPRMEKVLPLANQGTVNHQVWILPIAIYRKTN